MKKIVIYVIAIIAITFMSLSLHAADNIIEITLSVDGNENSNDRPNSRIDP